MEKNVKKTKDVIAPLSMGSIVEGKIVARDRSSIFIDLGVFGTGIIYGREFYEAKDKLKNLKIGDSIFTKIMDFENEEGYIELSLTKAGEELTWETLKQKKEKDENLIIKILWAIKGGILAKV